MFRAPGRLELPHRAQLIHSKAAVRHNLSMTALERLKIDQDELVSASPNQVSTTIDESVVILGLSDGTYYGLTEAGQAIWSLIQQPTPISRIVDSLTEMYEVGPDTCESDVRELLAELYEHKLIEVHSPGAV